jgi:hypothetical protein
MHIETVMLPSSRHAAYACPLDNLAARDANHHANTVDKACTTMLLAGYTNQPHNVSSSTNRPYAGMPALGPQACTHARFKTPGPLLSLNGLLVLVLLLPTDSARGTSSGPLEVQHACTDKPPQLQEYTAACAQHLSVLHVLTTWPQERAACRHTQYSRPVVGRSFMKHGESCKVGQTHTAASKSAPTLPRLTRIFLHCPRNRITNAADHRQQHCFCLPPCADFLSKW